MHKSDPVCVVSPPEGSPGADGVLADFIRTRKPLLLLATDPTHPIGGEWRQPRPQLRGGAADSRPDPTADHAPGWDSLSLCVWWFFFSVKASLLPDSRLCVFVLQRPILQQQPATVRRSLWTQEPCRPSRSCRWERLTVSCCSFVSQRHHIMLIQRTC